MPDPTTLRRLVGRDVDVDRHDGHQVHGRLLNVNRRSLWLLDGEVDRFVPLNEIAALRLAG